MLAKSISIVVPCYNEEQNIPSLIAELHGILKKDFRDFEIIAVDDGSTDDSLKLLLEAKAKYGNVKVIQFKKNFGQSAALDAGFSIAKGEIIVPMDGDMQNDPKDIKKLVEKTENFDLVCGWRQKRKDPFTKKLSSAIASFIGQKITGVKIHDSGCTLKAIKSQAAKKLFLYSETHRFIPALAKNFGYTITEEKVNHRQRKFGKTKYSIKRLFKGFMDILFITFWNNFSSRPLHFFGFFGFSSVIFGLLIAAYKVVYQFMIQGLPLDAGPLLLLSILLVIMGGMFLMMGFLAEITIRSYYESSKSKPYFIEKIY